MTIVPLLPFLYYDGKRIRKLVPKLPEAKGARGIARTSTAKKKMSLITVGESTIAGVGVETHEEGFSGTLAKELALLLNVNVEWTVYARSGYTVRNVTQKLLPQIKEPNPDLIVVGLGGNDAFKLNTPWGWRKHVTTLIGELRKRYPFTPVVFTNMPPIKEFPAFAKIVRYSIENLVEILGKTLKSLIRYHQNVFYSDEIITLKKWEERYRQSQGLKAYFSDGVHPSKLTYQLWARDIVQKIVSEQWILSENNHE
jgi:lysophospholipase L1-like esterase